MSVVETALKRPYTVAALLILITLMGIGAALRMPIDIFPEIDIPVVAVVWTYNGMSAQDIQNRILTLHERQLASLVDDISRIEAVSYEGVGVEKIYLHEGADVTRAISQLASSALVVLKYMPPNITPPLVLRYGATDVPIIQLSLSSKSLPDTKLNDLGQNIIRPALAVVHGAEVPYPYGGKPRVIMADLDAQALQARGLSPTDVSSALQQQNVILPAGDVKIGDQDYTLAMNNSPDVIEAINAFPIKTVDGRTVFMRDVAHVHDGFQVQTNSVSGNGTAHNQLLMNLASFGREAVPMVASQLNIRPVFDVHADVQGRDLSSAARDIDDVLAAHRPAASTALSVTLSGQVDTMRESYRGLFTGIALAIVLVYLFLVMNFQSWIDPVIVLMAVPFALGGVLWMLFLSQSPMSVPALMGTLMCIGLTTANSILVVSFANQRMDAGDDPLRAAASAGYTRLRPVLMTASAMILGMVPMALGIGEGGEQNAPLGRAVIGGLLFATFATLIFVPTMYRLLRRRPTPITDPTIRRANAAA